MFFHILTDFSQSYKRCSTVSCWLQWVSVEMIFILHNSYFVAILWWRNLNWMKRMYIFMLDWWLIVKVFSISSCVNIYPVFSFHLFMILVNILFLPLLGAVYGLLPPFESTLIEPLIKELIGPISLIVWVFEIPNFFKNVWISILIKPYSKKFAWIPKNSTNSSWLKVMSTIASQLKAPSQNTPQSRIIL